MCISFLLVITVGCAEKVNIEDTFEINTMVIKGHIVEREKIGKFKPKLWVEFGENINDNGKTKIIVKSLKLSELKANKAYKDYFEELGIVNTNKITVLDIKFKFESRENLGTLPANLTINTGEEVPVGLDITHEEIINEDSQSKQTTKSVTGVSPGLNEYLEILRNPKLKIGEGTATALLNTKVKDIDSIKLYIGSDIIIEINIE